MKTIFDPAFAAFGRAVEGIPLGGLTALLQAFPLPENGMVYSPREDDLHAQLDFAPWGAQLYADMPYQLGYCSGSNDDPGLLVRHGGSAYLYALTDFDLLLAHRWEGPAAAQRFHLPANRLMGIYGDTLRSAPLGQGFRILVILPYATNTEWQDAPNVIARNTWRCD